MLSEGAILFLAATELLRSKAGVACRQRALFQPGGKDDRKGKSEGKCKQKDKIRELFKNLPSLDVYRFR